MAKKIVPMPISAILGSMSACSIHRRRAVRALGTSFVPELRHAKLCKRLDLMWFENEFWQLDDFFIFNRLLSMKALQGPAQRMVAEFRSEDIQRKRALIRQKRREAHLDQPWWADEERKAKTDEPFNIQMAELIIRLWRKHMKA